MVISILQEQSDMHLNLLHISIYWHIFVNVLLYHRNLSQTFFMKKKTCICKHRREL